MPARHPGGGLDGQLSSDHGVEPNEVEVAFGFVVVCAMVKTIELNAVHAIQPVKHQGTVNRIQHGDCCALMLSTSFPSASKIS